MSFDRHRRAELAKIHIAKKEMAIDDDTYRLMLREIGGVTSSAALTAAGRRQVLEHLASLGFKGQAGKGKSKGRPQNMDRGGSRAAQMTKIEALLTIGNKPWSYGDALAKRICKVDQLAWVAVGDLYKIITALRKQAKREGWDLSGEG